MSKQIKPWGWKQDLLKWFGRQILKILGFIQSLDKDHSPIRIYKVSLIKTTDYRAVPLLQQTLSTDMAWCTSKAKAEEIKQKLEANCREDGNYKPEIEIHEEMLDFLGLIMSFDIDNDGNLDVKDTTT